MEKQVLILDQPTLERKLQRMAFQIWEHNSREEKLYFVGIEGSGVVVAEALATIVRDISQLQVEVLTLRMNKKLPLDQMPQIKTSLDNKVVVIIDDVANSGKTLLYALRPILTFLPRKVLIAVLINRTHKSFPIAPDIVGHSIATTIQEHIEVVCNKDTVSGVYLQ